VTRVKSIKTGRSGLNEFTRSQEKGGGVIL